jgi:polysaccharide biosynthesis/export protein
MKQRPTTAGKTGATSSTMSRTAFVLILSILPLAGQRPSGDIEGRVTGNLPVQPIGINDLVAVSVYGAPEFSRTVRTSAEGFLRLPMLKRPIQAEGLLPSDLEVAITRALAEEQILVDPVVTVTVAEYCSRPISVTGAVKSPLTFQAVGPVTLLQALARAGGLDNNAGPEILVTLKPAAGGVRPPVERIPVRKLMDEPESHSNLTLSGGEEVRVPEAGRIFVVGNVRKPGAYAMPNGSGTTLLQALAYAEGLLPHASRQAFLFRRTEAGERVEIAVELRKVLDRKAPDVALASNDILYIPDSKGSRLGMAALDRVLMFGSTAGATALIYNGLR